MNFVQQRLNAPGIPLLVTLYMFVVIGFGVILGIPALFDNGMIETQTVGWGGRELSDALEALAETLANTASAVMIGAPGLVGAACAFLSYRALDENAEALVAAKAS